MYTLGQAAKATGKAKAKAKVTLARTIKSGRISASRSEDGSYAIDPAELARVHPLTGERASDMERSVPANGPVSAPGSSLGEVEILRNVVAECDRIIERQDETIRQLWQRLDASHEERRMLKGLLTAPDRRPWWRRWPR
jgi:hypothetical protein